MRKLLFLLLVIFSLQVQGQIWDYYPSYSDSYTKLRNIAMVVGQPTIRISGQKYPLVLFVHGMGERGPGTKASLENLIKGFLKNDGTTNRWDPIITWDCQAAVNKYDIFIAAVNYSNTFSAANVAETLDSLIKLYPIDTKRILLIGFSLGGGTVLESILNPSLASRLAAAVPVAPVGKTGNWVSVVNTDLPVWGAVNSGDKQSGGATDTNKIKAAVNGINALNPRIPAVLTIFKAYGHGGADKMMSLTPPTAPGGWYFTNASGNIYEWLLAMDSDNPKTPPGYGSNTPVPDPINPTPAQPTTTLSAVAKEIGITTTATITLDGSASTGATGCSWGLISVPAGVSIYTNLFPKGSGWHTVSASLPKEGAYTFVLNAYNSTTTFRDTIVVTYQKTSIPVPVTPVTYDGTTGYLTFSDGTRVKAIATIDWATKKVVVKGEDGVTYTW